MKPTVLVLTCEHGSNKVPKKYAHLFRHKQLILKSPRAYDYGASHIARHLQKDLNCDLVETKITRLLIDCNHSTAQRKRCFSKYTKTLSTAEKDELIAKYYTPFYQTIQKKISDHIALGHQVLHLSIYTFAPFLKGLFLNTGIGLLYNAHRHGEKEVARIIHGLLKHETISFKTRHNYPFLGSHDYVLNSFRKQFSEKDYLGIKLGINQVLITTTSEQDLVCRMLRHSLRELLALL